MMTLSEIDLTSQVYETDELAARPTLFYRAVTAR